MPTNWDVFFLAVLLCMSIWGAAFVVAESVDEAAAHCTERTD